MDLRMDVTAEECNVMTCTYVMRDVISIGMNFDLRNLVYVKGLAVPAQPILTWRIALWDAAGLEHGVTVVTAGGLDDGARVGR